VENKATLKPQILTAHDALASLQVMLNAPKTRMNEFGGYKYRSCEDILEAAKPLLDELRANITLSDEIVMVGNRIYVKACAKFQCRGNYIETYGYAREAEERKGMDPAQLTGACSSYARKYALNGLLATDDGGDADSEAPKASEMQIALFNSMIEAKDGLGIYLLRHRVGDDIYIDLYNSFPRGKKVEGKKIANQLETEGQAQMSNIYLGLEEEDELLVAENLEGITEAAFKVLISTLKEPAHRELVTKLHAQEL